MCPLTSQAISAGRSTGTSRAVRDRAIEGEFAYVYLDGVILKRSWAGEVKNVSSLSYTSQLRDFAAYAKQEGLQFNLYVRGSTQLSEPLREAVKNGTINLIRSLPG